MNKFTNNSLIFLPLFNKNDTFKHQYLHNVSNQTFCRTLCYCARKQTQKFLHFYAHRHQTNCNTNCLSLNPTPCLGTTAFTQSHGNAPFSHTLPHGPRTLLTLSQPAPRRPLCCTALCNARAMKRRSPGSGVPGLVFILCIVCCLMPPYGRVFKIQPHKCAFAGIVEHKALQGRNGHH